LNRITVYHRTGITTLVSPHWYHHHGIATRSPFFRCIKEQVKFSWNQCLLMAIKAFRHWIECINYRPTVKGMSYAVISPSSRSHLAVMTDTLVKMSEYRANILLHPRSTAGRYIKRSNGLTD